MTTQELIDLVKAVAPAVEAIARAIGTVVVVWIGAKKNEVRKNRHGRSSGTKSRT
ncbi:hypothetical protein [Chitinimonas koreensis]|uniref:hypothetical protein n=1 Tax=Chitinimonas koreensis TaxID=356302 RepID=UPI0012FC0B91|nr:hypothetical protein [Chitinimonas koreensis]QNM95473.1 hypothetical protein H9L41_16600 [Chitinimonas koreensis]